MSEPIWTHCRILIFDERLDLHRRLWILVVTRLTPRKEIRNPILDASVNSTPCALAQIQQYSAETRLDAKRQSEPRAGRFDQEDQLEKMAGSQELRVNVAELLSFCRQIYTLKRAHLLQVLSRFPRSVAQALRKPPLHPVERCSPYAPL